MKQERLNLYFNPTNAFDLAVLLLHQKEGKGMSLSTFIKNVLTEKALLELEADIPRLLADELKKQRSGKSRKRPRKEESKKVSEGQIIEVEPQVKKISHPEAALNKTEEIEQNTRSKMSVASSLKIN